MLSAAFSEFNSYQAVTPDDFRTLITLLHKKAWALYVGSGGDVSVIGSDGNTAIFKNVNSGTILPITVVELNANGTTASNIIALYSVPRT